MVGLCVTPLLMLLSSALAFTDKERQDACTVLCSDIEGQHTCPSNDFWAGVFLGMFIVCCPMFAHFAYQRGWCAPIVSRLSGFLPRASIGTSPPLASSDAYVRSGA